jgi:C-terminal processing protease CtpA/Prc
MTESKSHEIDIRHANIRLCRLRPWSNYVGLGFRITECSQPPHLISLVESNSPAAAGGLRIWDVLIAINNEFVSNADYNQITMILEAIPIDNHRCIELLVVEQDIYQILKKKNIRIGSSLASRIDTPIRMPEDYMKFPKYTPRTCEIRLKSNDQNFGVVVTHGENSIGAYIQEVIPGSSAHRAGLRKSDRIIRIDGKYVDQSHINMIYEKLNKALIKRNIKLFVMDTETYEVLNNPGKETIIDISISHACLI